MNGPHYSGEVALDVEALRVRLRAMTDFELTEWGKAAAYMSSPKANDSGPPRQVFIKQLEEARAEWRRRHPAVSPRIDPAQ